MRLHNLGCTAFLCLAIMFCGSKGIASSTPSDSVLELSNTMKDNPDQYPLFDQHFGGVFIDQFYKKIARLMLQNDVKEYQVIRQHYESEIHALGEKVFTGLAHFICPSPCDEPGGCECDSNCTRGDKRAEIWKKICGDDFPPSSFVGMYWVVQDESADFEVNFIETLWRYHYNTMRHTVEREYYFSEDERYERAYFKKLAETQLDEQYPLAEVLNTLTLRLELEQLKHQVRYPYLPDDLAVEAAHSKFLLGEDTDIEVLFKYIQTVDDFVEYFPHGLRGVAKYLVDLEAKNLLSAKQSLNRTMIGKIQDLKKKIPDLDTVSARQVVVRNFLEGMSEISALQYVIMRAIQEGDRSSALGAQFAELIEIKENVEPLVIPKYVHRLATRLISSTKPLTTYNAKKELEIADRFRDLKRLPIYLPDFILKEFAGNCVEFNKTTKEAREAALASILRKHVVAERAGDEQLREASSHILTHQMTLNEALVYENYSSAYSLNNTDPKTDRTTQHCIATFSTFMGDEFKRLNLEPRTTNDVVEVAKGIKKNEVAKTKQHVAALNLPFAEHFREIDFLQMHLFNILHEGQLDLAELCRHKWENFVYHSLLFVPGFEKRLNVEEVSRESLRNVAVHLSILDDFVPLDIDPNDLAKRYRKETGCIPHHVEMMRSKRVEQYKAAVAERMIETNSIIAQLSPIYPHTTKYVGYYVQYQSVLEDWVQENQKNTLMLNPRTLQYDPYLRITGLEADVPGEVESLELVPYIRKLHQLVDYHSIETLKLATVFTGNRSSWKSSTKKAITKIASWFVERVMIVDSSVPILVSGQPFFVQVDEKKCPEEVVRRLMRRKLKRAFVYIENALEENFETGLNLLLPVFFQGGACINPAYDWVDQMNRRVDGDSQSSDFTLSEKISYILRRDRTEVVESIGASIAVEMNEEALYGPECRRFMFNILTLPLSLGSDPQEVSYSHLILNNKDGEKDMERIKKGMSDVLSRLTPQRYIESVVNAMSSKSGDNPQVNQIYYGEIAEWMESSPWYCNTVDPFEILYDETGRLEVARRLLHSFGYLQDTDDNQYGFEEYLG